MNNEMNPNQQRSTLPHYQRLIVYAALLLLGYATAKHLLAWIERKGRKSLW